MDSDIITKIKTELSTLEDEYRKKIEAGTISEDEKNYLMGIIHAETIINRVCRDAEQELEYMTDNELKMKLPTYNGWPVVANFSPIEGKWIVKTRHLGIVKGACGSVLLKEVLNSFLTRLVIEENSVSEKPYLPGALCDCGKGYKLTVKDDKVYCAYCEKEILRK